MNFLETAAELLNTLVGRKSWEMAGSGEGLRNYPLEKTKKDPTAQDPNARNIDSTIDIIDSDHVADLLEGAVNTNTISLNQALDLLYDYRKEQVKIAVANFQRVERVKTHGCFNEDLRRIVNEYLIDT